MSPLSFIRKRVFKPKYIKGEENCTILYELSKDRLILRDEPRYVMRWKGRKISACRMVIHSMVEMFVSKK